MDQLSTDEKLKELLEILVCPICKTKLYLEDDKIVCTECKRRYPILDGGIPDLLPESGVLPEDKDSSK
ncbi:MAG: Trm112 family protein [Planctomycetota bacterium]|jgi:uncharacterized protein YbaR (Trm112 family)